MNSNHDASASSGDYADFLITGHAALCMRHAQCRIQKCVLEPNLDDLWISSAWTPIVDTPTHDI